MTKMLVAALALSVLGYLAYRTMYGNRPVDSVEAPTERLQNARDASKRIEQKDQQHVEDVEKKTAE